MYCLRRTAIVATLALLPSVSLAAKPTDPIAIEADRMQYDNRKQINVFIGNVVLSQGDFEIRADRIRLRQDASGTQYATAVGSPARFRHAQSGKPESVEGSGKELRYNDRSQELHILNGATLRRLRPGASADEVHGARIIYRADRDSFVVEGGNQGKSRKNPRGRVRVVIQPQKAPGKGKAANLKPSPTLKQ